MGRHASATGRDRLPVMARAGIGAATAVVLLGAVVILTPVEALGPLPWAAAPECPPETVSIVVEPELADTVHTSLARIRGERLPTGGCVEVDVRAQEGAETVASSQILPPDRAPQIWVPDSAVWVEQITRWRTTPSQRFASSPVVVTTSRQAAKRLGWTASRPTWNQVLRGKRPMAVPDLQQQADSLSALVALWQTLGKGQKADAAVVNIVLASDRGQVPGSKEALTAARSGSVNAPVVPVTEQAVAAMNASSGTPALTAVYPREGSPMLTYPVMRVTTVAETPRRRAAVQVVLERLGSSDTVATARAHGFRGPHGEAAKGRGIARGAVRSLTPPSPREVAAMADRLEKLSRPSRVLTVLDVSLSMRTRLDDGLRRIDLASAASRVGMDLLPDSAAIGVWLFARHMVGEQDWREIAPVRTLGSADAGGSSQRAVLTRLTNSIDRYLTGGGTGLYDVTIAAVRTMHEEYDPRSANAIILMTDGADEDTGGATLDQVIAEIEKLNSGTRKVAVYTAGLGPDADYPAMRRIAAASGGWTYRIDTAGEGRAALLDGLRRSRHLTR
jgi:Ca-activated chloride channel family protein